MQRRSGWVVAVSGAILGACVVSEPPAEEQATQATAEPCLEQACGENSPVMGPLGFIDLSLFGAANTQGYAIEPVTSRAQIRKGASSYDLNVINGVITGSRNNVTLLAGQALVGATISIRRAQKHYLLTISDVRPMPYFVDPRTTMVEAYKLDWTEIGVSDTPHALCNNIQLLVDEGQASPILMGMLVWEAVVFEGDRINELAKTMSQVADDRWFNIGCAGSVLSKLLLTHHTIHSQAPQPRAWQQRQATMKMYLGDYCGGGPSFTVARQKLVWQSPLIPYLHPPWTLEARWNEGGATCLNDPRMMHPSTAAGPIWFPHIWDQIKLVCKPRSCTNLDPYDYAGADRVSANPHP